MEYNPNDKYASLDEAKEVAQKLSYKVWGAYFHVLEFDGYYTISKYYEENAKYYFVKNIEYKH